MHIRSSFVRLHIIYDNTQRADTHTIIYPANSTTVRLWRHTPLISSLLWFFNNCTVYGYTRGAHVLACSLMWDWLHILKHYIYSLNLYNNVFFFGNFNHLLIIIIVLVRSAYFHNNNFGKKCVDFRVFRWVLL